MKISAVKQRKLVKSSQKPAAKADLNESLSKKEGKCRINLARATRTLLASMKVSTQGGEK